MDQSQMIDQVLRMFNMIDCRIISTPREAQDNSAHKDDEQVIDNKIPFRSAVGCLLYLTVVSRPDISFSVLKLAKVVDKAKQKHWIQAKRLFRYLKITAEYQLVYKKGVDIDLKIFADADFANDEDRKSTSGFVAMLSGGPISWYSKTQTMIALSTMEAEYISLACALQESLYISQIMNELIESSSTLEIQVDNKSCISFAKNSVRK